MALRCRRRRMRAPEDSSIACHCCLSLLPACLPPYQHPYSACLPHQHTTHTYNLLYHHVYMYACSCPFAIPHMLPFASFFAWHLPAAVLCLPSIYLSVPASSSALAPWRGGGRRRRSDIPLPHTHLLSSRTYAHAAPAAHACLLHLLHLPPCQHLATSARLPSPSAHLHQDGQEGMFTVAVNDMPYIT